MSVVRNESSGHVSDRKLSVSSASSVATVSGFVLSYRHFELFIHRYLLGSLFRKHRACFCSYFAVQHLVNELCTVCQCKCCIKAAVAALKSQTLELFQFVASFVRYQI